MLIDAFCDDTKVEKILARGDTKCSVRIQAGMQIDLRIVDQNAFGAALLYFTGSKEHNIILRERAIWKDINFASCKNCDALRLLIDFVNCIDMLQ